jgi:putative nucleotidyltransferase with HDIG domain
MENTQNNSLNQEELQEELQSLNLQLKEKQEHIEDLETVLETISTRFANSIYQFIEILGSIVAFQEKFYEGSHSRFVSTRAVKLAQALKMTDEEIWQVQVAGLLHDIGKVGFKDAILAKFPQEMNEKEMSYYQTHCELGREILKKFSDFNIIAEIVYQHHEYLDGSGFPQGLRGKQIHPGAQIIAIVNTFHNLVYKNRKENDPRMVSLTTQTTLPPSKVDVGGNRFQTAIGYLHQWAGVLFEKRFVEAFVQIMEEERKALGQKIIVRVPVQKLEPGMVIYQNYYTTAGLLVAASGEVISEDSKRALIRLAEYGAIPANILVMK